MTEFKLKNSVITIQDGAIASVGGDARNLGGERAAIITDENVAPLYAVLVSESLKSVGFETETLVLPAGEASKTLESVSGIYEFLAEHEFTRTDLIIALGGGVIGDMAGFAAATYLRGIPSIQIPTSLLAQVDSSVGGKCGVDLPYGKNLVGAFNQPNRVIIDPSVLKTLPDYFMSDGMAEVIKYGCIMDSKLFELLSGGDMKNILSDVITRCVSHKRDIVERDELDTGVRMTLNFGHTIGHAVERHGKYSTFTHGNAVAIGMVASARIGEHLSLTASGTADKIAALLKRFNLPTELPCRLHELLEYIMIDKKTRDGYLNMILLTDIGHCTVRRTNLHELKELCEVF